MAVATPTWEDWQANMTHTPSGSAPSSRSRRDYYDNFVNAISSANSSGNDALANAIISDHSLGGSAPAPASSSGGGSSRSSGNSQLQNTGVVNSWQQQQDNSAALALQRGEDAYAGGLERLRGDITYHGYNPDDYNTQIERYLGDIQRSIPTGDLSPDQYYTGDIYNPWKTGVEQEQITGYQDELNQFLSPGFATDMVSDNLGTPILQGILDSQYDDASGAVTRARDRGTLNESGYNRAISDLGDSRSGGFSRLDSIRDGLVEGYRTDLRGQADQSRDRLNNFTLGDSFDSAGIQTNINDYYANLSSGFEGDFRNAFGGDQLFDWNKHIQQGGVSQGVTGSNLNAPVFLAGLNQRDENENTGRGLGNTGGGVF